jgi:hypothetical protein
VRGSLPNPKTIDMKLNSVTQEVTRAKLSVLGDEIAERKIALATEGFTRKFSVDLLKDRSKLSKENSWTISEYIIAMKREINPKFSYIGTMIQVLSEISFQIPNNLSVAR